MNKFLLLMGLCVCLHAKAQLPEDALRNAWIFPSGTAREQAIGGAMGSIGGDISSNFVNPAGLGLYKTSEIVFTPGWSMFQNKGTYLGNSQTAPTANNFNLGASGVVFSYAGRNSGAHATFSIAVNRTGSFDHQINYQGTNTYSSMSEAFAEEFSNSGLDINGAIFSPNVTYGTRMALYTSLIDTATINGTLQVIGQPQKAGILLQQNHLRTSGGSTEIAISLASSHHEKWYWGIGVGIPIITYTRDQRYTESDASGNTNNDFESFTYHQVFTSKGAGVNGKLGIIYKPNNNWRLGAAIHTPSVISLTDRIEASMITHTENYTTLKTVSINADSLDQLTATNEPRPNSVKYTLYTPWHFLLSGSYLIGAGNADTRKQKGFITADLEYITVGTSSFHIPNDQDDGSTAISLEKSYYDQVNQAVKENYKGVFALRLGGELKFNTLLVRAGGAYYTNPYKGGEIKADHAVISGGLGYRNSKFFVDLTYLMAFNRDIDVPYLLGDKQNLYSSLKEHGGTLLLTTGFKF